MSMKRQLAEEEEEYKRENRACLEAEHALEDAESKRRNTGQRIGKLRHEIAKMEKGT